MHKHSNKWTGTTYQLWNLTDNPPTQYRIEVLVTYSCIFLYSPISSRLSDSSPGKCEQVHKYTVTND